MAMIKCPECGKDMSDKAAACPNCGCPIEDIKARISEIEAEKAEKERAKKEEKKAKEVAEEIKRQQKEEAKKAITPEMKKKRVIVVGTIVVVAAVAGILGWYYGIKLPKEQSYSEYLASVNRYIDSTNEYNASINAYNDKAKEIISVNEAFDSVIKSAQDLIDSGDTPFEGEKITILNNTIKDARNIKLATPVIKEVVVVITANEELKSATKATIDAEKAKMDQTAAEYADKMSAIIAEADTLETPDYSQYEELIAEQSKELEESFTIQKQITAPTEEWVIKRLGRVESIATIEAATEENDPNGELNKPGWYTAAIYFTTPIMGTQNLTGEAIIDKGMDAGGKVEVYRNAEEAESRNKYLGSLDGMAMVSPGYHEVLGTMVLRASQKMKASEQITFINEVREALISVD